MSEASQQLIRQWRILQTLEASRTGCTVQELLTHYEVADKTIRRDLDVLESVFPITVTMGHKGLKRWKMKPLTEQLGFQLTDLISIHMGRQFFEPLAGTPFWEGFHRILLKVQSAPPLDRRPIRLGGPGIWISDCLIMDLRLAVAFPTVFLIRSSLAHTCDQTPANPMLELRN